MTHPDHIVPPLAKGEGLKDHDKLRRHLMLLAAKLTGIGHDLAVEPPEAAPDQRVLTRLDEIVGRINDTSQHITKLALENSGVLPDLAYPDSEPSR